VVVTIQNSKFYSNNFRYSALISEIIIDILQNLTFLLSVYYFYKVILHLKRRKKRVYTIGGISLMISSIIYFWISNCWPYFWTVNTIWKVENGNIVIFGEQIDQIRIQSMVNCFFIIALKAEKSQGFNYANSVTAIGDSCFYEQASLISIILLNYMTTTGNRYFFLFFSSTSITISISVIITGNNCFYQCASSIFNTVQNFVITIENNCF
jgi:hypothetical protein